MSISLRIRNVRIVNTVTSKDIKLKVNLKLTRGTFNLREFTFSRIYLLYYLRLNEIQFSVIKYTD